jgi:hypothetical protein
MPGRDGPIEVPLSEDNATVLKFYLCHHSPPEQRGTAKLCRRRRSRDSDGALRARPRRVVGDQGYSRCSSASAIKDQSARRQHIDGTCSG